jgi:hypothetical protein
MAVHDPKIMARDKFINSAAQLIINMENSKAKVGWEITGPMFKELFEQKDSKQLKDAYDKLKGAQPKGGAMLTPAPTELHHTVAARIRSHSARDDPHAVPMPVI